MGFILEFLFYVFYLFIKLYSLLDKKYIFSTNGSKLKKYITESNLKNTIINFGNDKKSYSFKNFFSQIRSLWFNKQVKITLLVTISIFFLKLSLTYNFLMTNFFYVNILNKNINLTSGSKFYFQIFRDLYYITFFIFILDIVYKFISCLFNLKINNKKLYSNDNGIQLKIGEDVDKKDIILKERGLFQNILITGSIGSGKTSSAISNILYGLISNNMYGLVIDVKGTYIDTIKNMADRLNKKDNIVEISLSSEFLYNPLDKPDISSFELANRLKQVLLLTTESNTSDSYWLDKSESFLRDFINIIRAYKKYVDFIEIHKLVINRDYLEKRLLEVKQNILKNNFNDSHLFNLNSAIENIKNEYLKLDDRTVGIIKSEITRITSIFASDFTLANKFCSKGDDIRFTENKIIVLSINIGENKLLAKIIATYLKLDFQKQILSQKFNFKNVFFVCDEFQEIANEEDARFFSISREYKCVNVISMQSYTSLSNTIGKENAAKVIIQNLVNKIWFRNDDIYTVGEIIKQIGKEDKKISTVSFSENSQNSKYNIITNRFNTIKSGLSESYSLADKIEYKYSEEFFTQKLKTFEAICMLSDGNKVSLTNKVKLKRMGEIYDEC